MRLPCLFIPLALTNLLKIIYSEMNFHLDLISAGGKCCCNSQRENQFHPPSISRSELPHTPASAMGLGRVIRAPLCFNKTAERIHLIRSICFFDPELSMGTFP
jgi:hypothetical protein